MAGEEGPTDTETTCSVCYAEFLEPEDLAVHVSQVHEVNIIHCKFCSSTYRSMEDYALHIINIHILSLKACKHCTKVFTSFDTFKKHENKHVRAKNRYFCSQCPLRFDNTYKLQQHEMKNHDNNIDGVFLTKCLPILSSHLNIKAMDFILSFGTNAGYICTRCVFTSPSPNDYLQHLQTKKCISAVCNTCCNTYKERKGVVKHLERHKECWHIADKELKKVCPKCEQNIELYIYTDHVKKCKPIKCNLCNIILNSMEELTCHQSSEHPMAITMKRCKFCHKEFVGNTALQKHIDRKHKAELHLFKYTCVYCDSMYFKHPQKLFCHFFSKHIELKPYCCMICNMNFRIRKKFTIHIKLVHNSIGFVEFDAQYHVYFTDNKSENPFIPRSLFSNDNEEDNTVNTELDRNDLLNEQTDAPTDVPTDVPTDIPTDAHTDTEEVKKTAIERKPPKIRFKEEEKSKESKLNIVKTEVQSEGNQTENESKFKSRIKLKKLKKKREENDDSDTEDEPLIKIKRRINKKRGVSKWNKKKNVKLSKKCFICNICKQNCYTFQNYNHHMSFHFKDEVKKCIKCSKQFTSKIALKKHIAEKHTTSRLTEALKTLIERRKIGKDGAAPEMPTSEKFRRTIKRVKSGPAVAVAKITETSDEISVKNFLETFTPEEKEESIKKEKSLEIESSVTIKKVPYNMMRSPAIKMTKFVPRPPSTAVKLSMPIRFKTVCTEKPKLNVKVIQNVNVHEDTDMVDYEQEIDYDDYEIDNPSKNEIVPDVAQEVMLETQQPKPKQPVPIPMQHKVVIPKLPKNYNNEDIKIAHLLPVAPFFKIVKMKDVLEHKDLKYGQENNTGKIEADVTLPGGAKLVNVNPLAHLIGNTPVEKIVGPSKKHYTSKYKTDNFEQAIAKALLKLEQSPCYNKKKKLTKKKDQEEVVEPSAVEIEQ